MTNKKDSWIEKDVVAAQLECSEMEVERLAQRGTLKKATVKKKTLYDPDDVKNLSEERENRRRNTVYCTGEDLDKAIESIESIDKHRWLPKGVVTLLIAAAGRGKSMLALEVVRRVLQPERGWFDGQPLDVPPNSKVVWCETESFQAGLKERINALGIPKKRILLPSRDPLEDFRLDEDSHRRQLRNVIEATRPLLVVVDSLRGGHGKDENDSKDMIEILLFLSRLARDFNIAVLVIHHVRKPATGEPDIITLDRQRGSSVTGFIARTVWALDKPNPASDLRLGVIKSNVARIPDPLGLKATSHGIEWIKEVPKPPRKKGKVEEAMEFLRKVLKSGPRLYKELKDEADQEGISESALKRAAKRMGVIKEKRKGNGLWEWRLSPKEPKSGKSKRGKSKPKSREPKRGASLKPSDALSDNAD